jgi:CRP-like cAMP-binding protein
VGEHREVLKKCEIFDGLSEAELDKVEALVEAVTFESGNYLMKEDEKGGRFYVVLKGRVEVEIQHPATKEQTKIASVRAGELLGEMCLVDGTRRSASGRAAGEVKAIAIEDAKLRALMDSDPAIGYRLMRSIARLLASRVRDTNLRLRNALADIIRIY